MLSWLSPHAHAPWAGRSWRHAYRVPVHIEELEPRCLLASLGVTPLASPIAGPTLNNPPALVSTGNLAPAQSPVVVAQGATSNPNGSNGLSATNNTPAASLLAPTGALVPQISSATATPGTALLTAAAASPTFPLVPAAPVLTSAPTVPVSPLVPLSPFLSVSPLNLVSPLASFQNRQESGGGDNGRIVPPQVFVPPLLGASLIPLPNLGFGSSHPILPGTGAEEAEDLGNTPPAPRDAPPQADQTDPTAGTNFLSWRQAADSYFMSDNPEGFGSRPVDRGVNDGPALPNPAAAVAGLALAFGGYWARRPSRAGRIHSGASRRMPRQSR
jgi:hypothetical protein